MKAKTIKRLGILIAVLSLVGGTGFYTQQIRVKQTANAELTRADAAAKEGDFAKAEVIYRLYLEVFPDDVEIQIKFADAILKVDDSPNRQEQAIQIYGGILTQTPARADVRRLLMQLKVDTKHFISRGGQDEGADAELKRLLGKKEFEHDGHLWFLMGRCQEERDVAKDEKLAKEAEQSYQKAIQSELSNEFKAPERIEAYRRRASLLRDRLDRPEEADRLIKAMVDADPGNYAVYLERGRYRLSLAAAKNKESASRQSLLSDAKKDFEEARNRAPREPEIYLELAKIAENESRYDEARGFLEQGRENVPSSATLCEQLASVYVRDRKIDKAIEVLDGSLPRLKSGTEQARIRLFLAKLLAHREGTDRESAGKLLLQIEELKKVGCPRVVVEYLTACYYIKIEEFLDARRLLTSIQPTVNRTTDLSLKVQINLLLAQCYGRLNEPENQREAIRRADIADPQKTRRNWIAYLHNQGQTEEVIKEYQAIVDRTPEVRLPLARLLIDRNKLRPESQRDWSEVERVIDDASRTTPESPEPIVLRAECLLMQGKTAGAREEIEKARARFPRSVEIRVAQANLLGFEGHVDEALSQLDQARDQLGDQVDLRLARARVWTMKKGPEATKALSDLAKNIETFSKEDRHKLLNGLAVALKGKGDFEGASDLWSQLAEQEPKDMGLRRNLLELAFQIGRKDEIEENIKQIEEIEGRDGLLARYCQAQYSIWQAKQRSSSLDARKAQRTEARKILNELMSRRPDWSLIPITLAQVEEQELDQGGLEDEEKEAKEERIIGFYLQAIKLGNRTSAVLRGAVDLLSKHGRSDEVIRLLSSIPVESRIAGDLRHQVEKDAVGKRDFDAAEEMVRKAIEAHPDDFSERLWLVWILLAHERRGDAEAELRHAVDLSKTDPDRWVNLINFMVITKQVERAEQDIRRAEASLPPSQAPLALARCCEIVGKASKDEAASKWYGEAKEWYKKAEDAHPEDVSIKRRLTEFFLRTNQISAAEDQLNAILKQGGGVKAAEMGAWARRTLALVLVSGTDNERVRKALYYFEPNNQPAPLGQEGKNVEDPDDLRVLAQVLEAQKTDLQRKRAIDILESLADKNLASPDDRFRLAQLCERSGDWPRAREKYRELNSRTKILPEMETLNHRSYYVAALVDGLLRHHQSGDEQNLAEAKKLVDEIKQLQPDALGTVQLQVRFYEAQNQRNKAAEVIRAFAGRSNLTVQELQTLAYEAEKLGQLGLAEQLFARRSYARGFGRQASTGRLFQSP